MVESWPCKIPYADISWTVTTKENTIRFTPERGRSKVRRASTKPVETLAITLTVDAVEFKAFRSWYKNALNDGVNQFWFPDFIDDGEPKIARFSGVPQWTKKDDKTYTITASLEFYDE